MKTEHAEDAGPLDEAALVTAAQHDRAAFGAIYERYVDQIYREVYRQVGNHVEAEDLTARTFQLALARLTDFEPQVTTFGAWLSALAGDLLDRRERRASSDAAMDRRTSDQLVPTASETAAWAVPHDASSELHAALRQLPLDQHRALVLKFARKRTSREIGESLGLSEDAAQQLIHRALIALRAALES